MRFTTINRAGTLTLLLMATASPALALEPVIKHVTLKEFTQLTIEIVPDLGTRFVFPFVLDEQDAFVPFTLNITNPVFSAAREPGRNAFVVTSPPPSAGGTAPTYIGNLFVSVAGYQISATVKTTNDLSRHVSDIVFDLNDEAREHLIQQTVERRIQGIKDDYARKEAALSEQAEVMALKRIGELALDAPTTRRIHEEQVSKLHNGDEVRLYLKDVKSYDSFHLFRYEIMNDSSERMRIGDAALYLVNEDQTEQRTVAANMLSGRIEPGETINGVIATDDAHVFAANHIKLKIETDQGDLEVRW